MKAIYIFTFIFLVTNLIGQKAYTQEKGSKDRKEILDIFREAFGEEKSSVIFKVNHFLIKNNWACALVTPLKNGAEYAEPRWGLFQKVNSSWDQVNWAEGIEFEDDFELIDLPNQNSRIAKIIVKKYPKCSMDIFSK
jgi:hypothetical protein